MVHDWKEINSTFLEKKYQELKDRPREEAYFDYWFRLIKETQKKIQNNEPHASQLEATQFENQDFKDLVSILNQYGIAGQPLFYKGALSSIRPFQLSNVFPFPIFLQDPYLDQEIMGSLCRYLTDQSFLNNKYKIFLFEQEIDFFNSLKRDEPCSVFLDFTYYRTSLFLNFCTSTIEYGNFRQSLKQDLNTLYKQMTPGSLLCGNRVTNDYVKEILEMFCGENDLTISTQGSFWFLVKKCIPK